jgi:hypothetical protein
MNEPKRDPERDTEALWQMLEARDRSLAQLWRMFQENKSELRVLRARNRTLARRVRRLRRVLARLKNKRVIRWLRAFSKWKNSRQRGKQTNSAG